VQPCTSWRPASRSAPRHRPCSRRYRPAGLHGTRARFWPLNSGLSVDPARPSITSVAAAGFCHKPMLERVASAPVQLTVHSIASFLCSSSAGRLSCLRPPAYHHPPMKSPHLKPADYLKKILTARVYDVACESALEPAHELSARLQQHRAAQTRRPATGAQLQAARRLQQDGAPESGTAQKRASSAPRPATMRKAWR
jgi:hypothetical protein